MPAIEGHLPQDIVCVFRALLELCYLVCCNIITEKTLAKIQDVLARFHHYREAFRDAGVVPTFSLPHQHLLKHYIQLIQLFGTPNGLCLSITESKHIKAIKEPWRRSSRFNALGQMLRTNQQLDKLTALRVDFTRRNMVSGTCLSAVMMALHMYQILFAKSITLIFPLTGRFQDLDDAGGGHACATDSAPLNGWNTNVLDVDEGHDDSEVDDESTVLQADVQLAQTPHAFIRLIPPIHC